jgi:transcriptional regulator with XRE-family HTH domain
MAEPSAALSALGAIVRRLRQERQMSQWELSERAGVHKNTPGLIERGERSPALETINAIAGALDLRGSELLRLAEEHSQREEREAAS